MFFDYQRNRGILALLVLMVVGQLVFYYWPISSSFAEVEDTCLQKELDSLRQLAARHKDTIYPFNPNFISDYKGFKLGLTTAQLDKLRRFAQQVSTLILLKSFSGLRVFLIVCSSV